MSPGCNKKNCDCDGGGGGIGKIYLKEASMWTEYKGNIIALTIAFASPIMSRNARFNFDLANSACSVDRFRNSPDIDLHKAVLSSFGVRKDCSAATAISSNCKFLLLIFEDAEIDCDGDKVVE